MVPDSVESEKTKPTTTIMTSRNMAKIGLFIAIPSLVAVISAALFSLYLTPKTVSFNMKDTVDIFTRQAATQNLTPEQSQMLTRRFNLALQSSLDEYQQRHRVIILVSPAVISGAQDITDDIRGEIAVRMKGAR
ncbi:type-F conjugative transfer system protein TrbI [Serratia proteamaculans]|uniref:type-F conjugative transfer system protein TrbI n=1 Tax=Serratia proteamaculans TaxID=28151 RepID=UPI0039BE71D3